MDNVAYVGDGEGRVAAPEPIPMAPLDDWAPTCDAKRRHRKAADLPVPPLAGDCNRAIQLQRTIGPLSGVAILISSIIGSGIFISPAGVLRHSGSVGLTLLIWLVCGAVEALGGLCYIELGLLIPEHGGDFTYLLHAFGPLHHFFGPLPAFLQSWLDMHVSNAASMAILSLTFAQYSVRPFYGDGCEPPAGVESLVAALITVTLTAVNCIGVRWSTRLQEAATLAKLTALAIIVAGGAYTLSRGNSQHLATGFAGSTSSVGDLAAAFLSCLWAYGGWKNLNNITEEVLNPPRSLPLSILVALSVVTVCYLLVNVAYLVVLSPPQMLASPAVAFSFGELALGPAAFLMPLGVVLSVFGTLNGAILLNSRVTLAVARRGHHAHALSLVHVRRLTPLPALVFTTVISCAMIAVGDVGALLRLSGFTGSLYSVLVLVALLVMRRTMADAPRPYRVPVPLAVLRLLFNCFLVISPLVDHPRMEYLYAIGALLVGVLVYTPCVFYRWSPPFLDGLTVGLQKAFELQPAE